jgi:hypothetical protein
MSSQAPAAARPASDIASEIRDRVAELGPLVAEAERLRKAIDALDEASAVARPRRGRKLKDQIISALAEAPGSSSTALATELDANPAYVSTILRGLIGDGLVERQNGGYQLVAGSTAPGGPPTPSE